MNAVQPFIFDETLVVRTLVRDGDPWFVAIDVARALGYEQPSKAVWDHCRKSVDWTEGAKLEGSDSERSSLPGSPVSAPESGDATSNHGGLRHAKIIPESDVYRLIMRSNLPSAERFQDWVCEEVLPTIRRTGGYFLAEGAEREFLLQETEREIEELKARRHALNLELRRLEKRRLRLGGERAALPFVGEKVSIQEILDEIPPEGIRVGDLQRTISSKYGVSHSGFYRKWRRIREAERVKDGPDGSVTKT